MGRQGHAPADGVLPCPAAAIEKLCNYACAPEADGFCCLRQHETKNRTIIAFKAMVLAIAQLEQSQAVPAGQVRGFMTTHP